MHFVPELMSQLHVAFCDMSIRHFHLWLITTTSVLNLNSRLALSCGVLMETCKEPKDKHNICDIKACS